MQYYLPPATTINKDFLKQVLCEEKQLLQKKDVMHIEVPHYEELSVKALWPQIAQDEEVAKYFPNSFREGKGPGREYFFNVVNTIQPDFLKQMMSHANKQRMTGEGEAGQREGIKISQFWEEQLKAMPYLSRKYILMLGFMNLLFLQRNRARPCTSSRPGPSPS